jgi:hypothetical protein
MVFGGIEKRFSLFFQYVLKTVITSECQEHQILAPSIDTFSALLTIHPKFGKTRQACSPIGPLVSEVNIRKEKNSFTTEKKGKTLLLVCLGLKYQLYLMT